MSRIVITRKIRLRVGFLFGLAYLAFVRPTYGSLLLGLPVALVGLVVRGWAAGHIVKEQKLATTGPYAHTRNPLYFGSFLLAAGFALVAHWSLLLVVIALFAFIYGPTIEQERNQIRAQFPDEYPAWAEAVPAFVPRLTPGVPRPLPVRIRLVLRCTCVTGNGRRRWRLASSCSGCSSGRGTSSDVLRRSFAEGERPRA